MIDLEKEQAAMRERWRTIKRRKRAEARAAKPIKMEEPEPERDPEPEPPKQRKRRRRYDPVREWLMPTLPEFRPLVPIVKPVKQSISAAARRKQREQENGPGWTEQEWINTCKEYSNKCVCCGSSDKRLVPDHVIPLYRGGAHHISNIQPLCWECNLNKGITVEDYRLW